MTILLHKPFLGKWSTKRGEGVNKVQKDMIKGGGDQKSQKKINTSFINMFKKFIKESDTEYFEIASSYLRLVGLVSMNFGINLCEIFHSLFRT